MKFHPELAPITVAVRDRDTMEQERVHKDQLSEYLRGKIRNYKRK